MGNKDEMMEGMMGMMSKMINSENYKRIISIFAYTTA
jgi:hypothetical protein